MMKPARSDSRGRLLPRWRLQTAGWTALLAACMALAMGSTARGQFDYEGGTIRTKDLGDGVLDVHYFNEQSASGTGGRLHVEVVSPTGPSPRERNLEVVLYANFMRGGPREGTAYRFQVRLPEGAQRATVTLPYVSPGRANHPGNQIWLMLWDIAVYEDGRDVQSVRTYSGSRSRAAPIAMPIRDANTYHVMTSTRAAWSMLRLVEDSVVPSSLQPEMFRLLAAIESDSNAALAGSLTSKTNFGISSDWNNVANIRTLRTAPTDWQYYLQYHYVVLDGPLLTRVRKQLPGLSEALKQYVSAGGSVLLVGHGQGSTPATQPGQEAVDQWLSESAGSSADRSERNLTGDWKEITAPVEVWWERGLNKAPAAATSQLQPVLPTPMATVTYPASVPATATTAVPVPVPAAPRLPSDSQFASQGNLGAQTTLSAEALSPNQTAETVPLTIGGCARDVLTALETYSMAQFGTSVIVADKWIEVVTGNGGPQVMSQLTMTTGMPSNVVEIEELFMPLKAALENSVADLESHDAVGCSIRSFGLGQVGVVEPDLTAHPVETLSQLARQLSDSAATRINSANDGGWTWRNLISSVGRPPVWTFCAFVLLFGLLLGPGLLVFTGWMGRRSLLIFLVPCVSLVATILIAAFEIVHEGFDTNIRISSLLTIDEPTGQGFAWSRQTYFSGWPPREGLVFPSQVYFRPVSTYQNYYRGMEDPRRAVGNRVEVGEEQVQWTGWLGARQQQQLLIGHPAKLAVPLKATRIDARNIKLKNLTNEQLPFAAVRDGAEGYYLVTDLAPGAEVNCQAQTSYDVGVELTRIRVKHLPAAPMEMQSTSGWGWRHRYVSYATEALPTEMLDSGWSRYMSENLALPPFGFVTLQESSDAVYVPLTGNVTESKHLVVGRLVW